ncbi:MAG: hypothetical protein J4F41_00950 [Alphaproteobacteria bacterium]|nr:hypothetical protein [Alphaproteobacteria bacterium]
MTTSRPPHIDASSASLEEWQKLAEKTLKGQPLSALDHRNEDGITHGALFTAADRVEGMSDALSAQGARRWVIAQYLEPEADAAVLNRAILDEVEGGTERLIITADQNPYILPDAMDGVMADAISISFDAAENPGDAAHALTTIWANQNTPAAQARGHLGIDVIGDVLTGRSVAAVAQAKMQVWIDELMPVAAEWPELGLFTLGGMRLHSFGLTSAQELAASLSHMVALMRMMEASGQQVEDAAARIEINIAMDADLYGSITKARAARVVMDRLYQSLGLRSDELSRRMRGVTSERMMSGLDRDTNILRNGTAMLAMGLSGLGQITCLPHDWLLGSTAMSRRVARNAHHVLADEAQLSHVADPAQGSYYLDAATHDLAQAAWRLFQQIEEQGGIFAALDNGMLAGWADAADADRKARVNQGEEALLGVTIHPLRGVVETGGTAISGTAINCLNGRSGLRGGPRRPAAPWEGLRLEFQEAMPRCLMVDVGGNGGSAASASRWFNAVGIDGAVMTARDAADARSIIASARPDVLVLGGDDEQIDDDELEGIAAVLPAAIFAADQDADMHAVFRAILESLMDASGGTPPDRNTTGQGVTS